MYCSTCIHEHRNPPPTIRLSEGISVALQQVTGLQNQQNEAIRRLEEEFERRELYLKDPKDGGLFISFSLRSFVCCVGCICMRLMFSSVMS